MPTLRPTPPTETSETPPTTDLPTARTVAENKLWAALRADPSGGTTVQLASMAGIGRSTAAKILARWAGDGITTRTTAADAGTTGRAPERWSISDPATTSNTTENTVESATDPGEAVAVDDAEPAATPESGLAEDPASVTPATTAPTPAPAPQDRPDAIEDRPEPDADSLPARSAQTGSCSSGASDAAPALTAAVRPATPTRAKRLPPGGLRGLVEDHLRDHPDQAFGPSQIGKALGRSGGAVANALLKLVEAGTVVRAQAKPLRYALAPAEHADPATPATAPNEK